MISAFKKTIVPSSKSVGLIGLGFLTAFAITVTAQNTPPATNASANCDIKQAADFAIQSNLQMVNSTTVNPAKYFTPGGSGSCISGVMLQNFDLSNLIPDFMSIITGALENAINGAINGAMRSVCNAANNAVQNTVGQINTAIGQANNLLNTDQNFRNLLGSELGYGNVPGSYPGGTTYGVNPNNTSNNAFGITAPAPVPGQGGNTSGSTNPLTSTWGSSTGSSTQAVALAAASEQARLNMEQAWSAYTTAAGRDSYDPESAYQSYLSSVNAYNSALQAEAAAQAGTTFGSGSNGYTAPALVTPRPRIANTTLPGGTQPVAGGSGSTGGSLWSNLFGGRN